MIPDFPHNIRIRLAELKKKMFLPAVAKSLPCWLSQFRKAKVRQPTGQRLSNVRVQQKKFQLGQSYSYIKKESLVSSNLNSKQLRFLGVRPTLHILSKHC